VCSSDLNEKCKQTREQNYFRVGAFWLLLNHYSNTRRVPILRVSIMCIDKDLVIRPTYRERLCSVRVRW